MNTAVSPGSDLAARLVVTGAGGQLGQELVRLVPEARAFGRSTLDITEAEVVRSVLRSGDIVLNCAAYTAVDLAETEQEAAFAGNETGPAVLAAECARVGARLIHVSTDYVFDGTATQPYQPTDPTAPVTVYGRSKLAGEKAVLESSPQAAVVRTAWVYCGKGNDFVATMLRLERERETVDVVDDQFGSPTYAADVASGLLELAARPNTPRLLHATNGGQASWFELARAVFAAASADPQRVRPCDSTAFPRPARRPGYSVLSGEAWRRAGLTPLRPWQHALADAVAARCG